VSWRFLLFLALLLAAIVYGGKALVSWGQRTGGLYPVGYGGRAP
jgi:hypothetical protein